MGILHAILFSNNWKSIRLFRFGIRGRDGAILRVTLQLDFILRLVSGKSEDETTCSVAVENGFLLGACDSSRSPTDISSLDVDAGELRTRFAAHVGRELLSI